MAKEHPSQTLLLIEDDDATRQGLTALLQKEGYQVAAFSDGRQALDYLQHHPPPDLILLDMLLPVLDGWHFLEHLDQAELRPRPKILIMTATQAIGREWALAHNCCGFVQKPIDPAALRDEIRRCLETDTAS